MKKIYVLLVFAMSLLLQSVWALPSNDRVAIMENAGDGIIPVQACEYGGDDGDDSD